MCADIEIRQGRAARPSPAAILEKTLAGQEGSLPGQRVAPKRIRRKHFLELFNALEADRNLRVDDWIDDQHTALGATGEHGGRPFVPPWIGGHYVQNHIAVDKNAQSSNRVTAMISSVLIF